MDRVPRRSVLRAVCAGGLAATGGCVSLASGGFGGRQPGALTVHNRDDRPRAVDVCAKPATDAPTPRTTMRLDAGARRTRDGFVATAGRYAVEVRLDGEDEVRAETAAAYERTDRETLRGDPIGIVIEGSGATIVSPADGTYR